MPPLILLTNDDGHRADGLAALRRELVRFADVVVCAPDHNQSAIGHALTLHEVIRLREVAPATFAIRGTPADAVYVALHPSSNVLPRPPALVVSGMNQGPNLGVDVNYSGTVAAAREAALRGLPAVAVSRDPAADLGEAAALAGELVRVTWEELRRKPPTGAAPLLLNVNIPAEHTGEMRITSQGGRPYVVELVRRTDPRGREYIWIGSGTLEEDPAAPEDSDTRAFHAGAVTLTPLSVDQSAREHHGLCRRIADGMG